MIDVVLAYLIANKIPLTVANYITVNTLGDCSTLDELGPEDRAELDDLIEEGLLVETESQHEN